MLTLSTTEE